MAKVSLAISHTPWIPERVANLERITGELGKAEIFGERCPNWVWSHEMWSWALKQESEHCLFLQDDLEVAPNFWGRLWKLIADVPNEVISLYNGHPGCKQLAREGYRWCTTTDGLVGMGYVFPRKLLSEFLQWNDDDLLLKAVEKITEDTLIDLWAMSSGHKIYHPIPTLIDHYTEMPSTYGNDTHRYRRPAVTWKDEDMLGPHKDGAPHLGRFYRGVHWYMKTYLKHPDPIRIHECERDECPLEYARFFVFP